MIKIMISWWHEPGHEVRLHRTIAEACLGRTLKMNESKPDSRQRAQRHEEREKADSGVSLDSFNASYVDLLRRSPDIHQCENTGDATEQFTEQRVTNVT